ncbi:hypothetical protein Bbelb_155750 [Branchiostoma belcheri]|nr:hypothetical protein Bbelb_155750 [Branchiostoma belcheri]
MSGSRRTYRTLPLDVPHSPAERIALSRRTSRTFPREVPHSVLHSPAERPSKIDAYFVACAVPTKTLEPSVTSEAQKYVLGKSHIPVDSEVVKSGTGLCQHVLKHVYGFYKIRSPEVMPSARPSRSAGPCRYISRRVTRGLAVGTPRLARGAVHVGPFRSLYRAVTGGHAVGTPKQALTGGHAVGTPKQARGAVSIPLPCSHRRVTRGLAVGTPRLACGAVSIP